MNRCSRGADEENWSAEAKNGEGPGASQTAGLGAAPSAEAQTVAFASAPEPREPLQLIVYEVELEKLHNINLLNNRFDATIWIPFVVKGGAKDPDLSAPGVVFPMGADGKPTFKPSAEWYMKQIDCRNALSMKMIDSKVLKKGDDLLMAVRIEGVFTERFELHDFPFQCQGLTLTINLNCRLNGPMPVQFVVGKPAKIVMTCIGLCPPDAQWAVSPELHVRSHDVGWGDRSFPAISFTAKVTQKPFYYLVYLAAPFGIFSLVSILTGSTRRDESLDNRAQLTLMQMLTAATYQMAITNKLPPIQYLTVLDYYTITNNLIVILVCMQSRVLILLIEQGYVKNYPAEGDRPEMTGTFDAVCIWSFVAIWLALHIWFCFLMCRRWRSPRIRDDNLLDSNNLIIDSALRPVERGANRRSSAGPAKSRRMLSLKRVTRDKTRGTRPCSWESSKRLRPGYTPNREAKSDQANPSNVEV